MNSYWIGTGYRAKDAFMFMAGVAIKHHFEIGYSYDAIRSRLNAFSQGSHELMLALLLNKRTAIISPSDFW